MTKEQYIEYHQEFCEQMKLITKIKNHDYTADSGDPFQNFKVVEGVGITSTEIGFLTRMMDKVSRITTFVKNGTLKVNDESVQDTLLDLANYAALMSGYLKSKQ